MPELPEVETTRAGIAPLIEGRVVDDVLLRARSLRQPLRPDLRRQLSGQRIEAVARRAKYLILRTEGGGLLIHLGMSGSLRFVPTSLPPQRHDHVDLVFGDHCLRLRDPRRFGLVLWQDGDPLAHPLLRDLGPEPLTDDFDGAYLYRVSRGRRLAVKALLMDSHIVVGIGNIYANEALFAAGIHPARAAGRIAEARYRVLAKQARGILAEAIARGGTTLRDFRNEQGRPGYFAQRLQVYGRGGEPCPRCARPITRGEIAQRSSFYCPHCQR